MEITIKLANLTQLEAVVSALEIHVDMETDRSKDDPAEFKASDKAHLEAARKVLAMLRGR